MKSKLISILLCVIIAIGLNGQTIFEGNAASARYGEFPSDGLYGASNTFDLNTLVTVTNPTTGKRIRVVIVKRVDEPGLFLLLSPDAASELGIGPSDSMQVTVAPVEIAEIAEIDVTEDVPFHPDPDINPVAEAETLIAEASEPESELSPLQQLLQDESVVIADTTQEAAEQVIEIPDTESSAEVAVVPEITPEIELEIPAETLETAELTQLEPEAPVMVEEPVVETPEAEPEIAVETTPEVFDGPLVVETEPVTEEPTDVSVEVAESPAEAEYFYPEPEETNAIQESLAYVTNRSPQKTLYLPPHRENPFAFMDTPEKIIELSEVTALQLPEAKPVEPERPYDSELPIPKLPEETEIANLDEALIDQDLYESQGEHPSISLSGSSREFLQEEGAFEFEPDQPKVAIETPEKSDIPPVIPDTILAFEVKDEPVALSHEAPEEITSTIPVIPDDAEISLEPAELRPPQYIPPNGDESLERPMPEEDVIVLDSKTLTPLEPGEETPEIAAAETAPINQAEYDYSSIESMLSEVEVAKVEEKTEPVETVPESVDVAAVETPGEASDAAQLDQIIKTLDTEKADVIVPDNQWAQANLPLVRNLVTDSYYLQVGAYSNPKSAKDALDQLSSGYPLAVMPAEATGKTVYKVFVGPLNEDEKGTLLFWFKAKGYKDAFVRRGGE